MMNQLEVLLEKYKFLWNHYKLQNDSTETRRHFLWLVESALLLSWYKLYTNTNCLSHILSVLIIPLGIVISFSFLFVLRRDRESIFLTEKELRDVECQINQLPEEVKDKDIKLEKFKFDKDIAERNCIFFRFSNDHYNSDYIREYWKKFPLSSWIGCIDGCLKNYKLSYEALAKLFHKGVF